MRQTIRGARDGSPPTIHIALATAVEALRTYQKTALILGVTLLGALAAALPIAFLFGRRGGLLAPRLAVPPIRGGDLGLDWRMGAAQPWAAQQEAASTLGTLLLTTGLGALLVGAVTMLAVAAAREGERRTDLAVRRAVGASRRMLLGSALLEAALIGLIPGALGAVAGILGARTAAATWPGAVVPGTHGLTVLAVLLLSFVLLGGLLYPVLLPRRRIAEAEMHRPLSTAPAVFQLGACFIVLTTGALIARRAHELATPGATGLGGGTVVAISLPPGSPAERAGQYRALLAELEATGLDSVSLTSPGALTGLGHVAVVTTECGRCIESEMALPWRMKPATHKVVSADTFRLMGLPVLAGRGIERTDDWDAPRVAVVSRSLAAREFQDGQPIGRRIRVGDDGADGSVVVGIVDDQMPVGLGGAFQPRYAVYLSVLQHPPRAADLLVRGAGSRPDVGDTAQRAVHALLPADAEAPPPQSESSLLASQVAPLRWFGRWFAVEGWAMLGLATLGIVAFMRLWVRSLAGEIGTRRSVGARRRDVLALVVRRSAGIGAVGIGAGWWFGVAIWSELPTVVAGTDGWDVRIVLAYALVLVGVAIGSAILPAWRASRALPVALVCAPDA